jgi:hypothetical protein
MDRRRGRLKRTAAVGPGRVKTRTTGRQFMNFGRFSAAFAITVSVQRKNSLLVRCFQTIFEFSHSLGREETRSHILRLEQVRNGLAAGESWIRTTVPGEKGFGFAGEGLKVRIHTPQAESPRTIGSADDLTGSMSGGVAGPCQRIDHPPLRPAQKQPEDSPTFRVKY